MTHSKNQKKVVGHITVGYSQALEVTIISVVSTIRNQKSGKEEKGKIN